MKLTMNVSSHNENDDGGCVLACVNLAPQLAELAIRRIESLHALQAQDGHADEVYFWNYDAVFFDPFSSHDDDGTLERRTAVTGEQLFEKLEKATDDFIEVDAEFEIPEGQIARVDCSQMVVRKEGIAYVAIPKHASFYVETCELPAEILRRAAKLS